MAKFQVMPDLTEEEFDALKSDIAKRGIQVPIEYDEDGSILDGHHRVRACAELGIENWPRLVRKGMTDDEKLYHARQLNLARRQLNRKQREALWSSMRADGMSYRQIAEADGTVRDTTVMRSLSTAANAAVDQPEYVTGKDGKKRKARKKPIKTSYVDPTPEGEREALATAKAIRAKRSEESRAERVEKIGAINSNNSPMDTTTRYPIIYADPPWRYENPPMGATGRSIENHYPTLTLEEICALPVSELAAPDAMLYLWATAPKLIECLDVVSAWGFEYRTNMVWDKTIDGMGYHTRNRHELLLICKRGEIPAPKPGSQPSSVYVEKRGKHSAKPAFFAEMIEGFYPSLRKIELFARQARPGWDVWGNEV